MSQEGKPLLLSRSVEIGFDAASYVCRAVNGGELDSIDPKQIVAIIHKEDYAIVYYWQD